MPPPPHPGDGQDKRGLGARLRRRATEVRAAVVLEEAGEVEDAARLFERVGAHAQAASLRLEHARTQRNLASRLSVLREACSRARGDSPEVRALYRELGLTLLEAARDAPLHGRRTYLLEAAAALERGGEPGMAGHWYDRLGCPEDAARCFAAAGDLERMEFAAAASEEQARAEQALAERLARARELAAMGERMAALALLEMDEAAAPGDPLAAPLRATRRSLEERLTEAPWLRLSVGGSRVDLLVGRTFRIGRGPDAHLPLTDPSVSRSHALLELGTEGPRVRDLEASAGTFLDGRPVPPGGALRIDGPAELSLGLAPPLQVAPVGTALSISGMPNPNRVWLVPPQVPVPLVPGAPKVAFDPLPRGPVRLRVVPPVRIFLAGRPAASSVDLLVGDHLRVEAPDADLPLDVEVVP